MRVRRGWGEGEDQVRHLLEEPRLVAGAAVEEALPPRLTEARDDPLEDRVVPPCLRDQRVVHKQVVLAAGGGT